MPRICLFFVSTSSGIADGGLAAVLRHLHEKEHVGVGVLPGGRNNSLRQVHAAQKILETRVRAQRIELLAEPISALSRRSWDTSRSTLLRPGYQAFETEVNLLPRQKITIKTNLVPGSITQAGPSIKKELI